MDRRVKPAKAGKDKVLPGSLAEAGTCNGVLVPHAPHPCSAFHA